MNLLKETEEALNEYGKTFNDVLWIGGSDFTISIDDFKILANKEYDNGYGSPEVATDLKIVGDGWWLERYEYDGSEKWVFKKLPVRPEEERKIHRIILSEGWNTLDEMN